MVVLPTHKIDQALPFQAKIIHESGLCHTADPWPKAAAGHETAAMAVGVCAYLQKNRTFLENWPFKNRAMAFLVNGDDINRSAPTFTICDGRSCCLMAIVSPGNAAEQDRGLT